jgi:putative Ig domain-containing protein
MSLLCCTTEKPAAQRSSGKGSSNSGTEITQQSSATCGPYTLEIVPKDPNRNSTLALASKGFDPSDATVEWLINGSIASDGGQNQFKTSGTRRGDSIQARARLKSQVILSDIVEIRNTPPEITSIKLQPAVLKAGDSVFVETSARDADGDQVTVTYEWTNNGLPAGSSQRLEFLPKRGDRISVKATPSDGSDQGAPVVVEREIANIPPVITEHNESNFDGTTYTYQVKASDPDGDDLVYSLESAPSGMTIDKTTGLIKWPVPSGFAGETRAAIMINDGHGGVVQYSLKISLK